MNQLGDSLHKWMRSWTMDSVADVGRFFKRWLRIHCCEWIVQARNGRLMMNRPCCKIRKRACLSLLEALWRLANKDYFWNWMQVLLALFAYQVYAGTVYMYIYISCKLSIMVMWLDKASISFFIIIFDLWLIVRLNKFVEFSLIVLEFKRNN